VWGGYLIGGLGIFHNMPKPHTKSANKSSSLLWGVPAECGGISVKLEFHAIEAISVRNSHGYMMKTIRPCGWEHSCSIIIVLWGVTFSLKISENSLLWEKVPHIWWYKGNCLWAEETQISPDADLAQKTRRKRAAGMSCRAKLKPGSRAHWSVPRTSFWPWAFDLYTCIYYLSHSDIWIKLFTSNRKFSRRQTKYAPLPAFLLANLDLILLFHLYNSSHCLIGMRIEPACANLRNQINSWERSSYHLWKFLLTSDKG
jgi:hypothetical protein